MEYLKRFKPGRLYYDSRLNELHFHYKQCVASEVQKAFESGKIPEEEFCPKEKEAFYIHLHEVDRVENDNLMRYYRNVVLKEDVSIEN